MIDSIEKHIVHCAAHIQRAKKDTKTAVKYHAKARRVSHFLTVQSLFAVRQFIANSSLKDVVGTCTTSSYILRKS